MTVHAPFAHTPDLVLRHIDYAPRFVQGVHSHPWSSVTLILSGGLEERVGRRSEAAHPLSVVMKPAGTPHDDRVGPEGARTIQLAMRPDLMHDGGQTRWQWFHEVPRARGFLRLVHDVRRELADAAAVEGAVFDFVSRLGGDGATLRPAPPRWLELIAEEVDDTFASGPSVRALALRAGVHPVSLARSFRRHFGTSVTQRIRTRRVQRAACLLGRSDAPLSSVAYQSGFADQSHLTRVFRDATGLTPARYRALSSA